MREIVDSPVERQLLDAFRALGWDHWFCACCADGCALCRHHLWAPRMGLLSARRGYLHSDMHSMPVVLFAHPRTYVPTLPDRTRGRVMNLDFAVVGIRKGIGLTRIAVEVDGHEFHERTKEQAARDRARDRALQAEGWAVARFTGSEVFHEATICVEEICCIMEARLAALSSETLTRHGGTHA